MSKRIFFVGAISMIVLAGGIFVYDDLVLNKLNVDSAKDQPHILRLIECQKIIKCASFDGDNAQPQVKVGSGLRGGAGYASREICEAVGKEELSRRDRKYGTSPLTRRYYECDATTLAKPRKTLEERLKERFGS
ncbi:hypothetical protein [Pseudomonas monteilii]|uniref:hypothetical protein n=1 Tax=Pseudomonas monteilii TaxID=76759 RepID=UPI0034E2A45C